MDNIYKQAVLLSLRFNTNKGSLSTEQLATLSMTAIGNVAKAAKKAIQSNEDDDDLSFLNTTPSTKDIEGELRFEIAKDLYLTKRKAVEAEKENANKKAHNAKIDERIAAKQDEKLESLSIEELEKMRR